MSIFYGLLRLSSAPWRPLRRARALHTALESLEHCIDQMGHASMVEPLPGATSWAAQTVLGLIQLRLKDPVAALHSFKEALTLQPGHEPAKLGLAEAYAALGDAKSSLKTLQSLLEANIADAWVIAAGLASEHNRFEDVNLFLDRAEHNRPDAVRSVHRCKLAHHLRRRVRRGSCTAKQRGRRTNPSKPMPTNWSISPKVTFKSIGMTMPLRVVTSDCGRLIAPTAWQDLAVITHQLGISEGALDLLTFALRLDPENIDIA